MNFKDKDRPSAKNQSLLNYYVYENSLGIARNWIQTFSDGTKEVRSGVYWVTRTGEDTRLKNNIIEQLLHRTLKWQSAWQTEWGLKNLFLDARGFRWLKTSQPLRKAGYFYCALPIIQELSVALWESKLAGSNAFML